MRKFAVLVFAALVWALVAPTMLWLACGAMGFNVGFVQAFGAVVATRVLGSCFMGHDVPSALR